MPLMACILAACRLGAIDRARGYLGRLPADRHRLLERRCPALVAPRPTAETGRIEARQRLAPAESRATTRTAGSAAQDEADRPRDDR